MTTGPEQRASPPARIVALCRAHPALASVVAGCVVAAVAAAGYLTFANLSQPAPATTAAAPAVAPGSTGSAAETRDVVVWRDKAGAIYRAKVDSGRLEQFLARQRAAIEAARTQSRDQAAVEIVAALKPVFADMTMRVPGYADWYFSYPTKYLLMGHALMPAFDYLSRSLDRLVGQGPREPESLVEGINAHMVEYLKEQYAERVVRPHQAEMRLQAAFDKSYGELHARWARIVAEQRGAMGAFINEQAGSAERLSPAQAAGLKLDWDGRRAAGTAMHMEKMIDQSFRGGLLSVTLKVPKSARVQAMPDDGEKAIEGTDQTNEIILNLFDKVVGPVVSQMGDLAIGIVAGGAASGTTVGFRMAGTPMVVATGVATAAPLGAAIGLAATIAAEMLSNRLEESLSRADFEKNLRQTVASMEHTIDTKMISVLDEHVEAWDADIVNPVVVK